MAELACRRENFSGGLDYVERSLDANGLNLRALTLKAAVLRHLGRKQEAVTVSATAAEKTDPLDMRLMAERHFAGSKADDEQLFDVLRHFPNTGLETAVEYGSAGLWQDGIDFLTLMTTLCLRKDEVHPLAYYYLAYFADQIRDAKMAAEYRRLARQAVPAYAFPFQWEAIAALRAAMAADPQEARAPYYLGNLLYDWQPEEATKLWETSTSLDASFPIVHRNLAVAWSHGKSTNDLTQAISQLEQAVAAPQKFALHFTELDELYAAAGVSPEKRLALLEQNQAVVSMRDDALSREIGLKIFAGKYDQAIGLMSDRQFSVWEGGTLEVADHWVQAHLLRGRQELAAGRVAQARADFESAKVIPDNLPSDQRRGGHSAEIAYWLGNCWEASGELTRAKEFWTEAAKASMSGPRRGPGGAEDRGLERQLQSYYQALAKRKLGQAAEAETALRGLIEAAERALGRETDRTGGVETSSERLSHRNRTAFTHCIAGCAYAGLGEKEKAKAEFEQALQSAPDCQAAKEQLAALAR
jgi:tetratricopeptide (TPR) repeat protein